MEILPSQDPIELFQAWLAEASKTEINDPEAMALATCTKEGLPSLRMVLLKGVDKEGFRFYTNMESRKGRELASNPNAALCFYWKTTQKQVRVEGPVKTVPAPLADAYFKTRHYLSQLGAWASKQSQPLKDRAELEDRVKNLEQEYKGKDIPRPPHWSGYIVVPEKIELWQLGQGRLHDRFLFTRTKTGWDLARLNP